MAQLVIVSNRVASPTKAPMIAPADSKSPSTRRSSARPASGSAGAARSPSRTKIATQKVVHDNVTYITLDLAQRGLPGILQRLRQPRAVADPALPRRSGRILAPRSRRLSARQRSLRARAARSARARRHRLGARLSPDAARQGAARARPQEPDRLLPAHPVPAAGNVDGVAAPRAADSGALRNTTWSASRPATMPSISAAI